MHNTKATFSSIDTTDLTNVLGGCGGKRRCKGGCGTTVINNNNITQAPAAAPQPSGTAVDVSVSGY